MPSTRPIYSTGSAWTLLQAGCPIRKSPDQRLLAATRGLSQQRYVLHRPLVPRHPPCALSSLTFLSSLDDEDPLFRTTFGGWAKNTRDIARLVKMRAMLVWSGAHRLWEEWRLCCAPETWLHADYSFGKDRGESRGNARKEMQKETDGRWWRWAGSNCRPPACKAGALPAELHPRRDRAWWAFLDSNQRPHGYQPCALTN